MRASCELGNQPAQLLGLLLQHVENLTKTRNWTSPSENRQNVKHQERQTRSNTWAGAGRWLVPWTPRPIAALPESSRVNADGLPYSPQPEVRAQGHTPSADRQEGRACVLTLSPCPSLCSRVKATVSPKTPDPPSACEHRRSPACGQLCEVAS